MHIYLEENFILQHFTAYDKKEQVIDSFAQSAVPSQTIFCICCVLFVLIFTFEYGNHLIWVILHGLTRQAECITLSLHGNQLLSTNGKSEHFYQKKGLNASTTRLTVSRSDTFEYRTCSLHVSWLMITTFSNRVFPQRSVLVCMYGKKLMLPFFIFAFQGFVLLRGSQKGSLRY